MAFQYLFSILYVLILLILLNILILSQVVAPRYGNYAEPQDLGVRKGYKVDGQVCSSYNTFYFILVTNILSSSELHSL